MVQRVSTVAFQGIDAVAVDVQVQVAPGLPAFNIVGLPDKAVAESRERVRAALAALGLALPPTPPYSLNGRLTRVVNSPASSTWKYDGFTGKVGESDLSGFAHFTTGKPRPRLLGVSARERRRARSSMVRADRS